MPRLDVEIVLFEAITRDKSSCDGICDGRGCDVGNESSRAIISVKARSSTERSSNKSQSNTGGSANGSSSRRGA